METEHDDEENATSHQMPDLDVPDPPPGMPYAQHEDYLNQEILRANGIAPDEDALLVALEQTTSVLQAAAAHTLGRLESQAAVPLLRRLLTNADELVQVEAAYALARQGFDDGKDTLERCLGYPVDASIVPSIAAGFLARLGDPRGFETIVRCFDVDIPAVRIVAAKQLTSFLPFHAPGQRDVVGLFRRALNDSSPEVQWQALVQLRDARLPEVKPMLEDYLKTATDPAGRAVAQEISSRLA
jgi:HEAT repeat protein